MIRSKYVTKWNDFEVVNKVIDPQSHYKNYISFLDIVNKLPKKELVKSGWLSEIDDLESLVPLFDNIIDNKFNVLFRKKTNASNALYALWLSRISQVAKNRLFEDNISKFEGLTKDDLKSIAKLSKDESNILELPSILSTYGIILVYEKSIKGMKLDGAVFKLFTNNPVIGISLRYPRYDYFWFTLMHELSHIVLHFEELDTPIFDDLDESADVLLEKQANKLAKESFVDRATWRSCPAKYNTDDEAVYKFADEVGVHPSIIAGQLRFEQNNYTKYNKIIHQFNVRKMVFGDE